MSRNRFNLPIILTIPTPTDENDIGGGTGHGSTSEVPIDYNAWLHSQWCSDLNLDNDTDEVDYAMWWEGLGFSRADWEELNPDLPWDTYFGN